MALPAFVHSGRASPTSALVSRHSERVLGLDLLRAAAIVLVLICHGHIMEASWAHSPVIWQLAVCGTIGVQLFFVLSGFLIGRILMKSVRVGGELISPSPAVMPWNWRSWLIFMMRRWMRTLPLYWTVLLLLAWVWPPMFWIPRNGLLMPHLLRYGSLTQNLLGPTDGWFAVSWSLSVEEWFYLTFSSLLVAATRFLTPTRAFLGSAFIFMVIPVVLRWFSLRNTAWTQGDEQLVPLSFDALAVGVLASWILERSQIKIWVPAVSAAVGACLVLFVWSGGLSKITTFDRSISRNLNYDILSLGFAFCLPASLLLRSLPRPLSLVVTCLSAWSYCLYLTHLSFLEILGFYGMRHGIAPVVILISALVLTFAVSWLSWRYFESRILRLRPGM